MTSIRRDLRYALRTFAANPGFTAMVVATLALGIGANTALFSVVDAVLLEPLPFSEPDRLVRLFELFPLPGGSSGQGSVSTPNFRDWQAARSFSGLAAYSAGSLNLQGVETPERLASLASSAGLFEILRAEPLLGRTLASGEDRPEAPPVAVISEGLWRRRFGADPAILGRAVVLDGQAHTVVGVMPAGFRFPLALPTDVWVPLRFTPDQEGARGSHWFAVLGRLRPGTSLETAQAEMRSIAAEIAARHPQEQTGRSVEVAPLAEVLVGRVRPLLVLLLGATGLVLLIACANAANLLLARAVARRREVAVRTALGAGRGRLVAQLLTESLLLAGFGAVLGLLVAWGGVRGLVALAADRLPRATEIGIDGRVAAFLVLVAVATGLAFGLVPALQSLRTDLNDGLREGGRQGSTRGGQAFRGLLVAGQIGLSLVLLVGAGLLVKTFLVLKSTETGMRTEGVLTLTVSVPEARYPGRESVTRFFTPVLERVAALPGVSAAGWTSNLPIENWGFNGNFGIEGRPADRPGEEPFAEFRLVSPGIHAALGVPVLRGRDFAAQDAESEVPVAVVNRALADRYFPGQDPVGWRLLFGDPITIVGVAGDVRQAGLDREPIPEISIPYGTIGSRPEMTLVVRAALPPETLADEVRAAIRSVDPDQPVFGVQTLEEVVTRSIGDRRLSLWLFGGFAMLALLLAMAGIYGVTAYAVGQRTREIGIRVALGAQRGSVLGLILRQGATLTLLGLAAGLAGALAATRLMTSLLHGVSATDPVVLGTVCAALAVVAIAACYLPARRAAEVDPVVALRAE